VAKKAARRGSLYRNKNEAARLIILQEKPINLRASQSNRLVLRHLYNSIGGAICLSLLKKLV
jgi:hypothetical protein